MSRLGRCSFNILVIMDVILDPSTRKEQGFCSVEFWRPVKTTDKSSQINVIIRIVQKRQGADNRMRSRRTSASSQSRKHATGFHISAEGNPLYNAVSLGAELIPQHSPPRVKLMLCLSINLLYITTAFGFHSTLSRYILKVPSFQVRSLQIIVCR